MAGPQGSLRDTVTRYEAHLDSGGALSPEVFLGDAASEEALAALHMVRGLRQADAAPGGSLGPYTIEHELGRGAQGTVYLATDTRLGRQVALKVLAPGQRDVAEFARRFRREAEAAGRLHHPNVCTVYEAGVEDGLPYIAMQYVDGPTLRARIADGVSVRSERLDRVHLVERVARALHAAHEQGLVHRDVKPGNIMLTADGEPIVCDFGMARIEEDDATLTRTGDVRGTPAYMAPEQITGTSMSDARTDVHALGVVLYELVTGTRPYEGATWAMLASRIARGNPERPRGTPRDLWVIIETAMATDPARRYATAHDLAEDLRRHREDLPIRARRPSAVTRFAQLVRRNKAASLAAFALFAGAIAFGVMQSRIAERERDAAEQVRRERARADWRAYAAQIAAIEANLQAHRVRDARITLESTDEALRGWEFDYLTHARDDADEVHQVAHRGSPAQTVLVSPDEKYLFVKSNNTLFKIDAHARRQVQKAKISWVHAPLAISPGGTQLACGTVDGVEILDAHTMNRTHTVRLHERRSEAVTFVSEHVVASVDDLGTVVVWHIVEEQIITRHELGEQGEELVAEPGTGALLAGTHRGRIVRIEPDGRTKDLMLLGAKPTATAARNDELLVGCRDGSVHVIDLRTEARRLRLQGQGAIHDVLCLEDRYVSISHTDNTLRTWDRTGNVLDVRIGHEGFRGIVPWNGDLVTSGSEGTMRRFRMEHRPATFDVWRAGSRLNAVALHPSGSRIAYGGDDECVHVVDVASRRVLRKLPGRGWPIRSLAFSPDGRWVAAGSKGAVQLWDAKTFEPAAILMGTTGPIVGLRWRPDGAELAAANSDGQIRIFDARSRAQVAAFGGPDRKARDLAWHPDGEHLLLASDSQGVFVYSRTSQQLVRRINPRSSAWTVDVSPDGRRVVTGGRANTAYIHDYETGARIARVRDHQRHIQCARFHPNGRRFVTSGTNGAIRLRDADTAETVLVLGSAAVADFAWSADGRRLVGALGGTGTGSIRIWETVRPPPSAVSPAEREADARLRRAPRQGETTRRLRAITRDPRRTSEAYRRVLEEAKRAVAEAPGSLLLLPVLAGAHFRCDEFEDALRVLRRWEIRHEQEGSGPWTLGNLWKAMTLAKLGAMSRARQTLARANRELTEAATAEPGRLGPLAKEANELLAR